MSVSGCERLLPVNQGRVEGIGSVICEHVVHSLVPAFEVYFEAPRSKVQAAGDLVGHHRPGPGGGGHPAVGGQLYVHRRHKMRKLAHTGI